MQVLMSAARPRTDRAGAFVWLVGRSLLKHNALEFSSALAFTAYFLNLFNLIPVSPLDGGRVFYEEHRELLYFVPFLKMNYHLKLIFL